MLNRMILCTYKKIKCQTFVEQKLREFRNEIKSPIDIHVKLNRFVRYNIQITYSRRQINSTIKTPTHNYGTVKVRTASLDHDNANMWLAI